MSISKWVRGSMDNGSWIRRMFEEGNDLKKLYGADNVFDLSLGNPIMEPPPEFVRELRRLVEESPSGMHRYMENAGYLETRQAVAKQVSLETGIKLDSNYIVMTCGAAGAMNVALKTILNPGDEVIIFAPFFAEYGNYIENHNGVVVIMPTDDSFVPDLDALEAGINARTKAVVINSPNNPSGAVYIGEFVGRLSTLLREKAAQYKQPIYLISDEAYRKIIFDGLSYPSPLTYYSDSIIGTSHSKDLALPGERIGYLAVHPDCHNRDEILAGMIHCNRILGFVNAPAMMQHIVGHLQGITISVDHYQRQRDFMYNGLTEMGFAIVKPQGAFYMFPRSPLEDDVAFTREMQQLKVLVVPGRGFASPGYFRIAYCVDDRTLEGSLDGFRKAAEKYRLS
ncbi:pyridoxal phosphate-dependent aminotransferase [Chloroflexota bacterium]